LFYNQSFEIGSLNSKQNPTIRFVDSLNKEARIEAISHELVDLPRSAESPVIYHGDECCKSMGPPMPCVLTWRRGLLLIYKFALRIVSLKSPCPGDSDGVSNGLVPLDTQLTIILL
jgi:hypothetical protein